MWESLLDSMIMKKKLYIFTSIILILYSLSLKNSLCAEANVGATIGKKDLRGTIIGPGLIQFNNNKNAAFGQSPFFVPLDSLWYYYYIYPSYPSIGKPSETSPDPSYSGVDEKGYLYMNGYRINPAGRINIKVTPEDAQVFIDGYPLQSFSKEISLHSIGLLAGSHKIEVKKEGYKPYSSVVEIKQNQLLSLDIVLEAEKK